MASARRQNLSEQVAARIKQLIIDEQLRPGDRLPTEQEMAERFGVSRVSVREATKALSFLGIIQAAPRRGLTIGEVDMRRVTEYLGFHLALSNYPKQELLQTRLVIETGALPYVAAAMKADEGVYERLLAQVAASKSVGEGDLASSIERDVAFHRALLEASGVGPLLVFDNLLQIFFGRFQLDNSSVKRDLTIEHHTRLIQLLHDGDLEAARKLLTEHIGGYASQLSEQ